MVKEIGETSVDLRKHSIKDTGGRSRKKYEDPPEGMYEDVDGERDERALCSLRNLATETA